MQAPTFKHPRLGPAEKQIKKKTRKNVFTGLSRDFGGDFVLFLPHKEGKKTHKQLFGSHPLPGQSRKFVCVYVFFLGDAPEQFKSRYV